MQVQLNSDNHITGSPGLQASVQEIVAHELRYVSDQITRVEVHLNDVNATKGGAGDKRCMLEARLAGMQPVSVEHHAVSLDLAIRGAAEQLARAIKNALGKAGTAGKGQPSIRHMEAPE